MADMPVLVAQRTVNHARDTLALSQWEEVRGVIALYKSLGTGGQMPHWQQALIKKMCSKSQQPGN